MGIETNRWSFLGSGGAHASLLSGQEKRESWVDVPTSSLPVEMRPAQQPAALRPVPPQPLGIAPPTEPTNRASAWPRHPFCTLLRTDDLQHLRALVPALSSHQRGTCVAFDLDETLITLRDGEVGLTQSNTAQTLQQLQSERPCFGLTARHYASAPVTWFDLKLQGLDLRQSAPWPHTLRTERPGSHYFDGVIYAGGHGKGDMLTSIMRATPGLKHLVLVDDQIANFVNLTRVAAETPGAPAVTCVWYSRYARETGEGDYQTFDAIVASADRDLLRRADNACSSMRRAPEAALLAPALAAAEKLRGYVDSGTPPIEWALDFLADVQKLRDPHLYARVHARVSDLFHQAFEET